MPFTGKAKNLEELFDILQILENQQKEGILTIENNFSGKSILTFYIKKGNLEKISANIKQLEKLKVKEDYKDTWKSYLHFINIFWKTFTFKFQETSIKKEQNSTPISSFLLEFSTEKDEIQGIIKKLIENPIKLEPKGDIKEENFSSLDLWLYGEIIKQKPIKELLFANIPLKEILRSLNKLFKANLIEVKIDNKIKKAADKERIIKKEKFKEFEIYLAKLVGPVAELLILETLEDLHCDNYELPEKLSSEFIKNLLEKIPEGCQYKELSCQEALLRKFNEIIST
ncbi:DUF4388 domain-containing protein [Thermodesulfatator atlanticus]